VTPRADSVMEVEFGKDALDRLEVDPKFTMGLPREVVKSYRRRMQVIRAAKDTRDLREVRGNHFERLLGARAHQHSIRLNDQWRLIVELGRGKDSRTIVIMNIEDYH
jgi:toxin HigB-1